MSFLIRCWLIALVILNLTWFTQGHFVMPVSLKDLSGFFTALPRALKMQRVMEVKVLLQDKNRMQWY